MLSLKNAVEYVKERVSAEKLKLETYVTTDNLKQNREGKEKAISLPPSGNTFPFYKDGDILIANIRPYLRKIWFAKGEGAHSADVLNLRSRMGFDPRFVYYNCFQEFFFDHMMIGAKGSKMPRGDKDQILDFPIPDYDIDYQKQISKVLSDLDTKIELNGKINSELESMAKLIYDYWFIQFDFPNKNGKPYKSSGGKMVYNNKLKREIPEGWGDGVLSDVADILMGQSPPGSSYNEDGVGKIFFQGSTDFGIRFPTIRQYTTKPSRIAKDDSILLSVRAPVGTLNQAMRECCIGRGLAALNDKSGSNSYLWGLMTYFKQVFDHRNSVGTTFGSITKDDLYGLKVLIPYPELIEKFKSIVDPFHLKIKINSLENQKLAEFRDWLLPMLMNGQVTVKSKKRDELHALFPTVNLYAEVAALQLIDRRMNSYSHGKTFIQKSMSHLKDIKQEERLKNVDFEEYHWGMFSKTIAQAIDNNPYLFKEKTTNGKPVYNVKSSRLKELTEWMSKPKNQGFVKSIESLISIYQEPLIHNDIDRIELLNTVYRCMVKLKTDNLDKIREGMQNWPMQDGNYKNKAEKFTKNETMHMIQFIKEQL